MTSGSGSGFDPNVRPSPQSRRLANVMRRSLRPAGRAATTGAVQVRTARRVVNGLMVRFCAPARGTVWEPARGEVEGHAVAGEWVRAPGVEPCDDTAILYMHGSGFVLCSLATHRGLVSRISAATGLPVFSLDYRLAPEHPFPAAHDDALAAYRWLLAEGYAPERIVVAGDSAGGHLSVSLAADLRREGLPPPAGLVLLSPFLDPSWEHCVARDLEVRDPFFVPSTGRRFVNLYMHTAAPGEPRVHPLDSAFEGLPPVLLQTGGAESLSAEGEEFAARIVASGGSCELQVWPGQVHVFQAAFRLVPEADSAVAEIGRFVRDLLSVERQRAA
jgi:epsilon-lactone hydrolase